MTTPQGQGRGDAALALAKEVEQLRRAVERVEQTAASARETAETAVRGIARNVGLGEQVDGLRTQLGEVAVQLISVASAVNGMAGLAAQVKELSDQVTALAERLGAEEEPPKPAGPALPSWFEVHGEQARVMLSDLVEWVDTILIHHFAARDALPECWMYHGEQVENLLWLRAGWYFVHRSPDAKPWHGYDWHDRWMPAVMARIKRTLGASGCRFDNHREDSTEHKVRQERNPHERIPETDPGVIDTYARWWVQTRGSGDVTPPTLPRSRQPQPPDPAQPQWGTPQDPAW